MFNLPMWVNTHSVQLRLEFIDNIFRDNAMKTLMDIFDTSTYQTITDKILKLGNGSYSDIWEIIQSLVNNIILPIGIALSIMFFIVNLIGLATQDNMNLEHYIKEFIKLIIGLTLVNEAWPLIVWCVQIVDKILISMNGTLAPGGVFRGIKNSGFNLSAGEAEDLLIRYYNEGSPTTEFYTELASGEREIIEMLGDVEFKNKGSYFSIWMAGLIPSVCTSIAHLGAYVAAIMRVLDCSWRAVLMPIGISNMYEGGLNAPGVKYLKSFFGAALSGVLMAVIFAITPLLESSIYEAVTEGAGKGITTGMIAMAATAIATVGIAIGASSKVKEVFS